MNEFNGINNILKSSYVSAKLRKTTTFNFKRKTSDYLRIYFENPITIQT